MKKLSRQDLESRLTQVDNERTNLQCALNDILNGNVVWGSWKKEHDGDGRFRVGISRTDSPSGGLAIVTFRCKGQNDYTSVYPLERYSYDLRMSSNVSMMPIIESLSEAVRAQDKAVA